jgi:hypothetical protein
MAPGTALRGTSPSGALGCSTPGAVMPARAASRSWPPDHDLTKRWRIIEMSRPTATAEDAFQFAMNELQQVKTNTNDEVNLHVRSALSNMAYGLKNLSVGLRATYMLLEEVQKDLRQYNSQTRRP